MQTKLLNYYTDEDISVNIEPFGKGVLFHVEISNWKLSVLKRCYVVCARLMEDMAAAGFIKAATITPNPKFAKLFGGTTTHVIVTKEQQRLEVITWELV